MTTISEALRAAREAARLTQTEAAERVGATPSNWCTWERGRFSVGTLQRICGRLGWRAEYTPSAGWKIGPTSRL